MNSLSIKFHAFVFMWYIITSIPTYYPYSYPFYRLPTIFIILYCMVFNKGLKWSSCNPALAFDNTIAVP